MLSNTLWFKSGSDFTQLTVHGHESDGATIVDIKSPKQLSVKPGLVLKSTDDDRLTCSLIEAQPDHLWKVKFERPALLALISIWALATRLSSLISNKYQERR